MADLKPEAAYFVAEDGKRTFYWFLDMEDQSDTPRSGSLVAKAGTRFDVMDLQPYGRGLRPVT